MTKKAEAIDSLDEKAKEINLPVVDLTADITGQWPGNTAHRVGHFYFNLNKLTLSEGQKALIGTTVENFVFERVDIHGIEAPEITTDIQIMTENSDSLGRFVMEESSDVVTRVRHDDDIWSVKPGTFMSKQNIILQLNNEPAQQGRIVINFVGYLIEPWR